MQLSVSTNFDDALIEQIKGHGVADLFGKLSDDAVGGGRASYMIGHVSRRRLAEHVRAAHEAGIAFSYLLNAACLDNIEQTRAGRRAITAILDDLTRMEVDGITVAVPILLQMIKRTHPHFKVRVSVIAQADTVSKVKWWLDEGADSITLDYHAVNREFATLRQIAKAVDPKRLQIMVNGHCVSRCPMVRYHMNALAHASQTGHASNGFNIDYCFLRCSTDKLRDPAEFLKGDWVRPEDLHHYEAMGYENFKIVERGAPTEVLVRRVKAYAARSYEGNFLDLIQSFGYPVQSEQMRTAQRDMMWSPRNWLRMANFKPSFLLRTRALAERRGWLQPTEGTPVFIDNKALDGFMDRFVKTGCRDIDCDSCRYCDRWAEKVVKLDPEYRERCVEDAEAVRHAFEDGSAFR